MLAELLSESNRLRPQGTSKRICHCEETVEGPESATHPTQGTTPLEAAMAAAKTFIVTLHPKLQSFVPDLIGGILKDASKFHYKSEKLNKMRADNAYVPKICRNMGMTLQALAEVQKTTGFKSLQDELVLETEALCCNWASRFVLPIQELNCRALKKRYQLAVCRLLKMAAKGFIAQVGMEGHNAHLAVVNLLVTHTDKVMAPLSINPRNFLILYKEASKLTTVPAPTIQHSMMGVINDVNGVAAAATGQDNPASTGVTADTAAATIAAQISTAKATVTTAISQKELADAIAQQARSIAEEAAQQRVSAKACFDKAQCNLSAAINEIKIAAANKRIMVAEVTYSKMDHTMTTKSHIALGASANMVTAGGNYQAAVRALEEL
jgi:hypothetical protein